MNIAYTLHESARSFVYKVFAWMGLALTITATVAYFIYRSERLFHMLFARPGMVMVIFLIQLGLVMLLSFMINKMSYLQAISAFLVYALTMGLTMSSIFYTYSLRSLCITFFSTASMFAVMALYGYFTKADLTSLGSYCIMGLFGLIISMLLNIWLKSATFDYFLSLAGIAIFLLLTAYDMQRILRLGYSMPGTSEVKDKYAVIGALSLYLDFINLFLMLLRFTGSKRD